MEIEIDHVGYAVSDLEGASALFKGLGFREHQEFALEQQAVKIRIFHAHGVHVELVAPTAEKSVVSTHLQRNGGSPYHLGLRIHGSREELEAFLRAHGLKKVGPAMVNSRDKETIQYCFHPAVGLLEFVAPSALE